MTATVRISAIVAASVLSAAMLPAQTAPSSKASDLTPATAAATTDSTKSDSTKADAAKPVKPKPVSASYAPEIGIKRMRPVDQRGINVFENPKSDGVPYNGFKLEFGGAFTQQFQNLDHSNTAAARISNNVDINKLVPIGAGFNNAVANLYVNAQLAPGIRVAMTQYLSARHHNETWVKDGYLLVDESPIRIKPLQKLFEVLSVRAGHFEVNYGDAHFRRTDNGNAMYNPLVGNYVIDAFTTEIGAEAMLRKGPFLAMAGTTAGESRGVVRSPEKRSMAYLGKIGFDKQVTPLVRIRLTGSMFSQARSTNNTLFTGDRAGSRYYSVMDSTNSSETSQAWSGAIQPGFSSTVHAHVINPFIKIGGLELFGNIEGATGRSAKETVNRSFTQNVYEGTYRFLNDQLFVSTRYNTVRGQLAGITGDVKVNRSQFGGGWFLTPNIMLKSEYVNQRYSGFPTTDIRSGGKFNGLIFEGVVAF